MQAEHQALFHGAFISELDWEENYLNFGQTSNLDGLRLSSIFWVLLCQQDKNVFFLYAARTENPDTSQTYPAPPISMNSISREHDMQTDNNRCQSTPPYILKQHLSVTWGVSRCLLASVGMMCSLKCLEGVWGI